MRSFDSFDSCYIAMLANLWAEMESILGACCNEAAADAADSGGTTVRVEALMLEIVLLSDRCESLRQRGLVAPEQAMRMRTVLTEIGGLLDLETQAPQSTWSRAGIVRAQNRVFDEVQRVARNDELIERQSTGVQASEDCHRRAM